MIMGIVLFAALLLIFGIYQAAVDGIDSKMRKEEEEFKRDCYRFLKENK